MKKIAPFFKIVMTACFVGLFASSAWANWEGAAMVTDESKAKVKVNGKIREIPVFHVTQVNCIFEQAETDPAKWTKPNYKQPECVTLRNQRVREYSGGKNPPAETKIWTVPANKYFKVKMTISDEMANRRGEQFGFQIVRKDDTEDTVFIVGGWKVGDSKTTKAIRLKPGEYYWRCPQNRTPWYGLVAK